MFAAHARTFLFFFHSSREPTGIDNGRAFPQSLRAAALGKTLRALDLVFEPPHVLSAGTIGCGWVEEGEGKKSVFFFLFYKSSQDDT